MSALRTIIMAVLEKAGPMESRDWLCDELEASLSGTPIEAPVSTAPSQTTDLREKVMAVLDRAGPLESKVGLCDELVATLSCVHLPTADASWMEREIAYLKDENAVLKKATYAAPAQPFRWISQQDAAWLERNEKVGSASVTLLNEGGGKRVALYRAAPPQVEQEAQLAEKMLRVIFQRLDLEAEDREQFIQRMIAGQEELTVNWDDIRTMANCR